MADKNRSRRKPLGFLDAQDRVINLNSIYRATLFGGARTNFLARQVHQQLDDVVTPEPDVELEDAELSDSERREAIARERLRRERRG
jgi:hypothetical protein